MGGDRDKKREGVVRNEVKDMCSKYNISIQDLLKKKKKT